MSRERLTFLISPAFEGVLVFQGVPQHVFGIFIHAARKALIDERFKVGGTFNCMAGSPLSEAWLLYVPNLR